VAQIDAASMSHQADDELATVARLRAYEQELSRRLDEARGAAEARVFAAREAAARVEALAEADCRHDVARLRDERARRLGALLETVRDETAQQVALAARRAVANREQVLNRLLAVVTGSGTP